MKRLIALVVYITVCYALFAVNLNKQYQSLDPLFKVSVPSNWSVTEENRGFVCLSQDAVAELPDYYPQLFIEAIATDVDSTILDISNIIDEVVAEYPEILSKQGYIDTKVVRNGQTDVNKRTYYSLVMSGIFEQNEIKVLQYIALDGSEIYILSFFGKSTEFTANEALFTEILHSLQIGN